MRFDLNRHRILTESFGRTFINSFLVMAELPKIIGSILALAALGSSMLSNVDAVQCLTRAGIAFFIGVIAGNVWNIFFTGVISLKNQEQSVEPEQQPESPEPITTS